MKTIRIWDGCKVLAIVSIDKAGTFSAVTDAGGADNSTQVDIEIDPFAGSIVDHSARRSPVDFREKEV